MTLLARRRGCHTWFLLWAAHRTCNRSLSCLSLRSLLTCLTHLNYTPASAPTPSLALPLVMLPCSGASGHVSTVRCLTGLASDRLSFTSSHSIYRHTHREERCLGAHMCTLLSRSPPSCPHTQIDICQSTTPCSAPCQSPSPVRCGRYTHRCTVTLIPRTLSCLCIQSRLYRVQYRTCVLFCLSTHCHRSTVTCCTSFSLLPPTGLWP